MNLVYAGFLWKKPECQRQKNSGRYWVRKEEANVDIVAGIMLFLILVLTIFFGFRMTQYMITAAGVEDALAASNLASAVIDLEEYGKSHEIYIEDVSKAFQIFRESLVCNLELDENLNTTNENFLLGQVLIKEYRVYNVRNGQAEIWILNGLGETISYTLGQVGDITTPDHVSVESTTIYSRIGYQVEGLAGQTLTGEKEKSIDIVRCNSE